MYRTRKKRIFDGSLNLQSSGGYQSRGLLLRVIVTVQQFIVIITVPLLVSLVEEGPIGPLEEPVVNRRGSDSLFNFFWTLIKV